MSDLDLGVVPAGVAPLFLGAIEGGVGMHHEGFGGIAVMGEEADSDAQAG